MARSTKQGRSRPKTQSSKAALHQGRGKHLCSEARELASLASDADNAAARKRMLRASRVLLAVGKALDWGADETLKELDRASLGIIRRLRAKGERVAWATQLAADRDAELIAAVKALGRPGQPFRFEILHGIEKYLIANGYLSPKSHARSHALTVAMQGLGDTQSATAVARLALRAIGFTRKDLKNFGAGVARREQRRTTNRVR